MSEIRQRTSFDATVSKPQRYICVRLVFQDGKAMGGVWTGKEWWSNGRRVQPKWWQWFDETDPESKRVQEAFLGPGRKLEEN